MTADLQLHQHVVVFLDKYSPLSVLLWLQHDLIFHMVKLTLRVFCGHLCRFVSCLTEPRPVERLNLLHLFPSEATSLCLAVETL